MMWKAIGESVTGSSHIAMAKGCDDAVKFITDGRKLVACISDGAGSALYGQQASEYCVNAMAEQLNALVDCSEADVYQIVEQLYLGLQELALQHESELNEWSCTLLGCYIDENQATYFQLGDGAIVSKVADDYKHIWWPHNGEYQNVTTFVVDEPTLSNLKIRVTDNVPHEVAIFTDGLQMLALDYELQAPHQPFFNGLFPSLRMADNAERQAILSQKLAAYLDSKPIKDRTDDDKTLFLATRM